MAAAARKKALVLFLTLATFTVEKKVSERRKYGMSYRSAFESEKEKEDNFQHSVSRLAVSRLPPETNRTDSKV